MCMQYAYIYTCHMIYYSLLPIYILLLFWILYIEGGFIYIYTSIINHCIWDLMGDVGPSFFSKTRADDSRMQTTNEDLWLLPDSSVSLCTCMPFHARTQTHIISITSNILLNHNFEYILYTITVSHSISHWIPIFIVFNSHGYPYVN